MQKTASKKNPKEESQRETSPDSKMLARMCKAMGHPARIKIIEHLQNTDQCICGEIVDILPLAQSTVSQHLKALKKAGLIKGQIEGLCTCYCLDKEMMEIFKKAIVEL